MEAKLENDWNGLRQGDEQALFRLYEHHYPGLLNYAKLISHDFDLSRDTLNQLFLELWERRNALPEVSNQRSYLMTYLRRKIHAELEKQRRHDTLEAWHEPASEPTFLEETVQKEQDHFLREQLVKGLAGLPPRQRELLHLKFYEELSYDEIAKRTQLSIRTVYNKIHEGIKALRGQMVR